MGGFKILGGKDNTKPPKTRVVKNAFNFREGAILESVIVNFVLMNGGVGDWICLSASLLYIAKNFNYVDGVIWAHPPMTEWYQYLFKDYSRWRVYDRANWDEHGVEGTLVAGPKKGTQLVNACGDHLVDIGFKYYLNYNEPPKGSDVLPDVYYSPDWSKWRALLSHVAMDTPYAVFTPGATAQVRTMPAKAFNELVDYTISKGVTPVFLGKQVVLGSYKANFEEGYDFTKGIDLREQTNLLEASAIMREAKFVIGLDNGLLHLAGTTDVPIIFGHNIAAVEHRRIKRPSGLTIDIALTQEQLACSACQSRIRFTKHHFVRCIQSDYLCLELLFRGKCAEWKLAIDKCLEHRREL